MDNFKLHGRTVKIARLLKNVSAKELGKKADIGADYLTQLERGYKGVGITKRNEIRILRVLRKELGYTEQELVALTILVENIKETEELKK